MAVDVHIIKRGGRLPEKDSHTGFGFEDEHEEIFRWVYNSASTYPQLAKMQDYYEDVLYDGQDLKYLVTELEQAILQFPTDNAAGAGLRRFLELSAQAIAENKALMLFAD